MLKLGAIAIAAALVASACQSEPAESGDETNASPQAESDETPTEDETEAEAPVDEERLRFETSTDRQRELLGIGFDALQAGDLDTTITALLTLADTEPFSDMRASGVLLLSEVYLQRDETARALALLEELRAEAPPLAELEFILGRTYADLDRVTDAEMALRNAIRANPEFLRSYSALAALLANAERPDDSAAVLLEYERQIYRFTEVLSSDATVEVKLGVIESLSMAMPDDRLSRAVRRGLSDNSVAVQMGSATALAHVGTAEALPTLREMAGTVSLEALERQIAASIMFIEQREGIEPQAEEDE